VPLAGIEPALLAETDFESVASTSSATGATRPDNSHWRARVNCLVLQKLTKKGAVIHALSVNARLATQAVLIAASYISATYSQFTRFSMNALQ
jgi:hypothetical protein